ncbi:MAG: class III cytochrome C family protein [Alphaproteobacteria bacterium]|nr:class III cytochrome C family protein [Alphaproteobacteria bacterium]
MIGRWLPALIGVALTGVIALALVYPHQMVGPGKLMPAHKALENDCLACHTPFQGASPERCMACHVVADIGRRTTKGVTIQTDRRRTVFHQALVEKNCTACHRDHPPPALASKRALAFDHSLLEAKVRTQCSACHDAPSDAFHRTATATASCSECHRSTGWKPAMFDHSRVFPLDADHNVACSTCHAGGDYRRYTCYGCHEHQQSRMVAEHLEEGIRNIENCTRCHNANDQRGDRDQKGRDDD